ncbi:dihydrofolate reductase [Mumia flava]|uniref:Dihydrofolate reductase n=1 Tax=Mumia flava TaxID=1348852 RepID=A0A0B2B6V5_9ACTN|nr:dihydrofolate reductase family protein [Mumia flava]PJJ57726.1 dihydrofolate reductase [Mumia flava]
MRSLVYLIAVSIDGFIAAPDGGTEMFPQPPEALADYFAEYPEACPAHARDALNVTEPARHFDTVLMGARTHQPALDAGLTSGYPHLEQYVFSHRALPPGENLTVVRGDPVDVVRDLKRRPGRDIWLCGGGDLAAQLVDEIDELHLKVTPVLLGGGVPLFAGGATLPVELRDTRVLGGSVVLARYRRGQ